MFPPSWCRLEWHSLGLLAEGHSVFTLGGGLVTKLCLTLATPGTVAHQALLSMGFPRQEYWSALLFPSLGDLPNPGVELLTCFQINQQPKWPLKAEIGLYKFPAQGHSRTYYVLNTSSNLCLHFLAIDSFLLLCPLHAVLYWQAVRLLHPRMHHAFPASLFSHFQISLT